MPSPYPRRRRSPGSPKLGKAALLPEVLTVAEAQPGIETPAAPLGGADGELLRAEVRALIDEESMALMRAGARSAALLQALGIPDGLDGADAEEWCGQELLRLKVLSYATLHSAMRWGTQSQAMEAAKLVATMTAKDGELGRSAPMVMVNIGGAGDIPPWERAAVKRGADVTVERSATARGQGSDGSRDDSPSTPPHPTSNLRQGAAADAPVHAVHPLGEQAGDGGS